MDDTPLMRELTRDHARRKQLEGLEFTRVGGTRIITVANQKGGVGKTSTTVNLAAALSMGGLNVLVLDADPQGNTSTALSIEHHAEVPSMYEVLVESAPLSEVIQQVPEMPGLFCAPATINLSGAEIELVSLVARENRLRNAIRDHLEEREQQGLEPLDYVLVDCPPSLGLLTVNALVAAREVLIPIQAEYYALEGLSLLLNNIDLIRQHLNPELVVSTIMLTMYDARTRLAAQVAQDVRDHFPDQTLDTTIPRSVRISEAPSYGQTVLTYDPSSSGALAYRAAAYELNTRPAPGPCGTGPPRDEARGSGAHPDGDDISRKDNGHDAEARTRSRTRCPDPGCRLDACPRAGASYAHAPRLRRRHRVCEPAPGGHVLLRGEGLLRGGAGTARTRRRP